MQGWEFRDFSWILQICVCVDVSVNEPDGSIFTQFLLLVLPHFVELEEEGKDKETPDHLFLSQFVQCNFMTLCCICVCVCLLDAGTNRSGWMCLRCISCAVVSTPQP